MKGRILLLALALIPAIGFAQDDFGTILSVEAEKKINKKFTLGLDAEMRTRDDVKEVGVEWLIRQCRELKDREVPCLHFYSMNAANQIVKIMSAI